MFIIFIYFKISDEVEPLPPPILFSIINHSYIFIYIKVTFTSYNILFVEKVNLN